MNLSSRIEKILPQVEKPARYCGGEYNSIVKEGDEIKARFCMAFPDTYEVGMSHLGSKIIYGLINQRKDCACERVFAPWIDMDALMRKNDIPLFSVDAMRPIGEFDIIGFTLQYEMCYTNIVNMLDLAHVQLLQQNRAEGSFVACGGPCACNIEPIAALIDFAIIGDGEETIIQMLDAFIAWKESGAPRDAFLLALAQLPGFYVPKFYAPHYHQDKTFSHLETLQEGAKTKIERAIVPDLDKAYFPTDVIVPFVETVHDRIMLELFRGCTRGCRFCQAGFLYRPLRVREKDTLVRQAVELEKNTGCEEISLTSLSTGDYPYVGELIDDLMNQFDEKHVSISLPSLRVDSFRKDYAQKVQSVRKTGLTFAPEAGTQRLRNVINKGVTEKDLIDTVSYAFESGWNRVKLYFMIGLPTETEEDLDGIVDLAHKVAQAYYSVPKHIRQKGLKITVSVATFVPKPFTPFQWFGQNTITEIERKQAYLKEKFRELRSVNFNYHSPRVSFLEAVFSRGDRRLFPVVLRAYELGCLFDSWSEQFNFTAWMQAFEDCGVDPEFYASRTRDEHENFAFEHNDMKVQKEYLWKEFKAALDEKVTDDCRNGCNGCFDQLNYENYCTI